MSAFWPALHFLRPEWLWALLALPLLGAWWRVRHRRDNAWRDHVDGHLLPHLLVRGGARARTGLVAATLAYVLAVLALAGPSWRQADQPLWQAQRPLVVVLDLSSRITTPDLPPSRLLQVRAKLARLLEARAGSPVALVVYADDAFTVAPLTDDAANIQLYLDELSPEIMPVDGQRAGRGIAWAARLLSQADFRNGDILVFTDRADSDASRAASGARAKGYAVSVLGLGTSTGAAYRGSDGTIGHAALDASSLRALATAGGGRYQPAKTDHGDLAALGVAAPALETVGASATPGGGKAWRDEGYWLLVPLMALALLWFRRGAALVLAAALWLPMSAPARAAGVDWWQRSDQATHARLEEGADAYRKGDYPAAEKAFAGIDTAVGQYNLGNALAKQQRYDDAVAAYDRALRLQPGMADAIANRATVDAARKRPPSADDGQGKPGQQGGNGQASSGAKGDAADADKAGKQQKPSPHDASTSPSGKPGQAQAGKGTPPQPAPPKPSPDPAAQAAADAAQRERMRAAMGGQDGQRTGKTPQDAPAVQGETAEQRERRQAVDAWLKRVPDEPGALLKVKFRLEHERRQKEGQ
ncbi:VWA domain-containing protein [Pseudoxanthomonas sp. F37]|uniref:VWA domain-containing protein n=1 Tax=Pseudoxanthomonas TaxID=83618 RepID=UPI001FD16EA6|nr:MULTISPECIES: VWA domain-containing protein [Pseudoxanthomonas]UOV04454.1 VWA domain-containing protein [Pseudoxanthomonas mexicana]UOV09460.1 VWA domain-containing protein [Pseudoxanthomonas sp. F37]